MRRTLVLVVLCLLAAVQTVAAAGEGRTLTAAADVHFMGPDGKIQRGVRCATPSPTAEEQAAVRAQVERWLSNFGAPNGAATSIPVAFHVVYKTQRGSEIGNVPQSWITNQISVLNSAFAGTGFSFTLASTDRTNNRKWFDRCASFGPELEMKNALAIDPAHHLNVYTCNPAQGILGYAYLPWAAPEDDPIHGIVLLYSSLPGGSAAPYNLGDTATHEVGHYLGLHHTFENGCNAPGDEVNDTPFEASPAFGCPVGRNTCPQTGVDPIFNFMDYTDDACMDEFTPEQASRMTTLTAIYRPSL